MTAPARLDDDQVLRLIEEVKKRPALYNSAVEFDKWEKARNWAEIAQVLDFTESTLKQKWKGLRDVFFKESRRCSHPEKYEGRWRFFHYLTFLYNTPRECTDDIDKHILPDKQGHESDPDCYEVPVEEELVKKRKNSDDHIPDDDYDIMFLNSLIPYFKQLPPLRRLIVRNKIQEVLIREIAGNLLAPIPLIRDNSAVPHTSSSVTSPSSSTQ